VTRPFRTSGETLRGSGKQRATVSAESLRIGGLTPVTTVDYPGELSAVVFCQGCPWRCRYCHNGHLLPAESDGLTPWSAVIAFLERRRGLLDAVVFSGGEPTLQAALPAAMEEAKSAGFKIGLHTAGPYPDRLRRLLPYLDWVGLDIKALPGDYPKITGVPGSGESAWESLELLLSTGIALEVRTTLMPDWTLEGDIRPLMSGLAAAGVKTCVLQHCRTESTLDPSLAAVGNPLSFVPIDALGELGLESGNRTIGYTVTETARGYVVST
jgi:pyruvate formate lyase activating enzyme